MPGNDISSLISGIKQHILIDENRVVLTCKTCKTKKNVFYRLEIPDYPVCDRCYEIFQQQQELKRRQQAPEGYLKLCGVGEGEQHFSFENYTYHFEDLDVLKNYHNFGFDLILMGPPGVGKTHISIAILREIIKTGYPCSKLHYYTENAITSQLIAANKRNGREYNTVQWQKLTTYDVLVIDDMGRKIPPSEFTISTMIDLIDCRFKEVKKTIINTNLTETMIASYYGHPFASRLKRFYKVGINGCSDYREQLRPKVE